MVNNSLLIHKLGSVSKFDSKDRDVSFEKFSNFSSSCGDKIYVFFDLTTGKVRDIAIIHIGCILSKAATNALLLSIENKTKEFAIELVKQFIYFFNNESLKEDSNSISKDKLTSELMFFEKFISYPSRKSCVLVPAQIIKNLLCKDTKQK